MPYMRKGKTIYHKKGGKWKVKQVCRSIEAAKAALRLLRGIAHGLKPRGRKK